MKLVVPSKRIGLNRITILQGLSSYDLTRFEPLTHFTTAQANSSLITAGESNDSVFFIVSGTVCIYRTRRSGKRLILNMIGTGEMLGEICALDNGGHSASAMTTEPAILLRMRRSDFCALEESIPQLSKNLKYLLANRLRFAATFAEVLAARKVQCRVARLLTALADRYGQDPAQSKIHIPLRLTQHEIAEWIYVSRQHAEKHMGLLRKQKIVHIAAGRHIIVIDRSQLNQQCD